MQESNLIKSFTRRIQDTCNSAVVPSDLSQFLNAALIKIGMALNWEESVSFSLDNATDIVNLVDDLNNPLRIAGIKSVIIKESGASYPHGGTRPIIDHQDHDTFEGGEALPSLYYIEAKYRKQYATKELDFQRRGSQLRIIKPRNHDAIEGVITYLLIPEFEQLDFWLEPYLLDVALVEWIDQHLITGQIGLIRVPTPNGSFEFDGGRALIALRDRLAESLTAMQPRTVLM